jgi:hypothetical protein
MLRIDLDLNTPDGTKTERRIQFWLRPKLKRQRRTSIVERMF